MFVCLKWKKIYSYMLEMTTFISVNTMQSGYVYVGPAYQYKTLTQAFAANQFQVVIPDEYVMEDTLIFNQDIIYSLTILDEIKISKLNINTNGTGLYIIFDGIGVVTFTSSNPFVYLNSTTGLALYFNSTRINSTVPYSIDATFIQASNCRFASDFATTFNKFSATSGIMSLNSCHFSSDVTLLDLVSGVSFTVNCVSCQFENLFIKATKELPTDPGTYLAFITLDSCVIGELFLQPDGSKILTPNINIIGTFISNIASDLLTPCTLYTSNVTNSGIALTTGYFPNLYFSNLIGSIIEDIATINSVEQSTIMSTLFNEGLTIAIGMDSSNITSNVFSTTLAIASAEDSNVTSNVVDVLDIGVINRCGINLNLINTEMTCNNVTDSTIGWNTTLPALSATTLTNSTIVGHKNILIELDTLNNSSIESNSGLNLEITTCNNGTITSNVFNANVAITDATGLTLSNNSTTTGQFDIDITNLDTFVINSNRLLNPNIVSATDGAITSNLYGSSTIGISSNVTSNANVLV